MRKEYVGVEMLCTITYNLGCNFQPTSGRLKMRMILCIYISTDAVAFGNAHFGAGSGTIHLYNVGCTGRETNLTDCPQAHSNVYCLQGHAEDAGVRCQGL